MLKRLPFIQKLLKRLDRVDKESLQKYVLDLAQDNELYQEILDELEEGVLLVQPDGQLIFANHQAVHWLGLDPVMTLPSFLSDQIKDQELASFVDRRLSTLKEKVVQDFQLLTPREFFIRMLFIPMESSARKIILILLINRTDQKTLQIDVDRLARIEALISLAAGIAHEIGNPLNSLSIHLQLLKKEMRYLPATRRKIIESNLAVMNSEVSRLDRIVRNFLKASRKPPLRFRVDDLNDALEQAIHFMEPEMRAHGVKVQFKPDPRLPLFLMDHERLYQGFINLIKNASEAMPEGGLLKILVSHKENIAVVRFQDEGSGIAEKDFPHIFEAYYTTKEEGSGLGLMIVFNTVSEHGGRIDVSSKVGKGTTFTLFLPMRQPKLQLPKYDVALKDKE